MDRINVFIVDDEMEACENLSGMLYKYDDINIVGTAHTTTDAELKIATLKPQVVFLDIEMHEENAFQFLDRISPFNFDVIFVTAYDEYAIWAFKVNAVDYILKPIDPDEVSRSLKRIKERHAKGNDSGILATPLFAPLELQIRDQEKPQQIMLRNTDRHEVVLFKDIMYVEAMGRYSKIYYYQNSVLKWLLMSRNISEYEELFPTNWFFRSHRSYLVNCTYIKQLQRDKEAGFALLKDKQKLPVSRRRYSDLMLFLKSNNFHGH
jgi:two-component system, LytTR family, response regulator